MGGGKDRSATKTSKSPHPWADIAAQTSFDVGALEVLADHHRVLNSFCADGPGDRDAEVADDKRSISESTRGTSLGLPFAQYCVSLHTLIFYGTAAQQFEFLFHAYAVESERGITRAELFQLLQDHFYKRPVPTAKHTSNTSSSGSSSKSVSGDDSDARHFERLYTWLKKHMVVYDRARCGFLSLATALEMLHAHPSALQHVQLQIDPLVAKMRENNAKYQEKAAAAQIK